MTVRCRVFAAAAIGACLAAVAAGASETPLDVYFKIWSSDRAQVNLRKQARCVVRKYPADARRVVVDDVDMRTIVGTMPHLMKPCGEGVLFKDNNFSISQPVYEFVLAEAFLAQLPAPPPLDAVRPIPPLSRETLPKDLSGVSARMRENFGIGAMLLQLDAAAECAVRRDPTEAWGLSVSQPHSDREDAALQRVNLNLRVCDPSAASAPPFILRGLVAYNLYRLLAAAHLVGDGKDSPHA